MENETNTGDAALRDISEGASTNTSGGGSGGSGGGSESGGSSGGSGGSATMGNYNKRGRRGRSQEQSSESMNEGGGGQSPINFVVLPTGGEPKENMNQFPYWGAFGTPFAGGFGGGYGGPALVPLEDKSCEILMSLGDVRGEVKDAECSTKQAIMESNTQRQAADLNLHNRLCEAEKASITANFEGRIATKDAFNTLQAQLAKCCCDQEMATMRLENNINEKFCALERRQDKEFDEIRSREATAREADLRERLADCRLRENNQALAQAILGAFQCAGAVPTPVHSH